MDPFKNDAALSLPLLLAIRTPVYTCTALLGLFGKGHDLSCVDFMPQVCMVYKGAFYCDANGRIQLGE